MLLNIYLLYLLKQYFFMIGSTNMLLCTFLNHRCPIDLEIRIGHSKYSLFPTVYVCRTMKRDAL